MGAASSTSVQLVDKETARGLAASNGVAFDEAKFDAAANEYGCVTMAALLGAVQGPTAAAKPIEVQGPAAAAKPIEVRSMQWYGKWRASVLKTIEQCFEILNMVGSKPRQKT